MFFINNDEPQFRLRGEKSTPRTNDNIKFPFLDSLPLIELLSRRELAVEDRYFVGKACRKSFYRLWSEGNFGN